MLVSALKIAALAIVLATGLHGPHSAIAQADGRGRAPGASDEAPVFVVANTATIRRGDDGLIETRASDFDQRLVSIERSGDSLLLKLDTVIRLWRIPDGLARIEWPVQPGITLSREDAIALARVTSLADVDTWGAQIDWPSLGPVTLIMVAIGPDQFAGLLSSAPSNVKVLRQMIFQRARPTSSRPRFDTAADNPCGGC